MSAVSRPRKSPRGVLCEEEQTPSEGSSGVPLLGPLGSSRNRSSRHWRLRPGALGSRPGHLEDTGVSRPRSFLPQRSGRLPGPPINHGGGPQAPPPASPDTHPPPMELLGAVTQNSSPAVAALQGIRTWLNLRKCVSNGPPPAPTTHSVVFIGQVLRVITTARPYYLRSRTWDPRPLFFQPQEFKPAALSAFNPRSPGTPPSSLRPKGPASHLPQHSGGPVHKHLSRMSPLSGCFLGAPVRGNRSRAQLLLQSGG